MIRSTLVSGWGLRHWPLLLIGAAIVVSVGWYLASPLFISKTVNEALPGRNAAVVPAGMTQQQVDDQMAAAAKVNTTMTESMPLGATSATALARGAFGNGDSFHKGEGTATVYRVGQNLVVRLDPFKVTNGPALHVYLSGNPAPRNSAELHAAGALDLGKLKGNLGAQNYPVPAGTDLSPYHSVVIYCQMFHVVFSTATLDVR